MVQRVHYLPVGIKTLWFWPVFRIVMESIDWNDQGTALGKRITFDSHCFPNFSRESKIKQTFKVQQPFERQTLIEVLSLNSTYHSLLKKKLLSMWSTTLFVAEKHLLKKIRKKITLRETYLGVKDF